MFNVSNNYFISSTSSPSLIFNHQHHNTRYHPYSRITTSYYPINEFETYSFNYNSVWNENEISIERQTANKKERRRTQSINTAFSDLRTVIPNVQPDTKLSKIKTLKLATKYIEFLMNILSKDDPTAMPSAFKAEIIKTRKEHRFDNFSFSHKTKERTGWSQIVCQSKLNHHENFHQQYIKL